MKRISIACLSLVALTLLSCEEKTPAEKTVINAKAEHMADSIIDKAKADVAKKLGEEAAWEYSQETDKMTSKVTSFAMLRATDQVDLGFPYKGSVPYIVLRNKRGSTDAMFEVTKGQLHHTYSETPYITVRFDEAKAERYYCGEPSDGSSNAYFITAKSKFIAKLRKAKKAWIETEFYQNGLKVMEFNCASLKWDH